MGARVFGLRVRAADVAVFAASLVAALAASGCVDEGASCGAGDCLFKVQRAMTGVETALSAEEVSAGVDVRITCTSSWDDGAKETLAPGAYTLTITPFDAIEVEDGVMVATKAGVYEVACAATGFEDETPSRLIVVAGDALNAAATLDRNPIRSGESTSVSCSVTDRHGNAIEGLPVRVRATPSRGVTIDAFRVTAEKSGDYEIECSIDTLRLDSTKAVLTVEAGMPALVVAELDSYAVPAGTHVNVTCTAFDSARNPIQTQLDFSVMPQADASDATGFSANTAGDYWVTCTEPMSGLSSEPVLLTVNPGLPAALEITGLAPSQPVYPKGGAVDVQVRISDRFGNEVRAAQWAVEGIPSSSTLNSGGGSVVLIADGMIELVARVTSETQDGLTVQDSIMVTVDGVPPVIDVEFPRRGEIVASTPGQAIQMRGRVTDATSPVMSLVVDGQAVTLDASGRFTHTLQTAWGINLIEAEATDGAGNRKRIAQSYELASQYRRAGSNRVTSGRIPDGVIAHIGQAALDDNASDVDDLATIARLAIQNANLQALIPNPATTYNSDCSIPFVTIRGSLHLHVDSVRFGTPRIDITAINGGLRLRVEVPNVAVDMHTSGDVCDVGVGVRGSATASSIVVTGDLQVSRSGGNVRVTMPSRNVQISNLEIDLRMPSVIDWAVDGIISLFSGMISSRLESAFGQVIQDQIPPVVRDFLQSFRLDTGFNLPAPLSTRLNLSSVLGMVAFDSSGGELGLDTTIYTTGTISPEPLGGILQEVQTLPSFGGTRPLAVALGYDLINQALYSLWYGGGLEVDLDQEFLPEQFQNGNQMLTVDANVRALLPPVLKPSGDPSFPLELQIGDLAVDLLVDGVPNFPRLQVNGYATAFIRASATIDAQGRLALALAPNGRIALEVSTPVDGLIDTAQLIDTLETALQQFIPAIFAEVLGAIPIPTFDLSNLAGGYLPPGIVLGLGNAQTVFHPSYVILEGALVQVP